MAFFDHFLAFLMAKNLKMEKILVSKHIPDPYETKSNHKNLVFTHFPNFSFQFLEKWLFLILFGFFDCLNPKNQVKTILRIHPRPT